MIFAHHRRSELCVNIIRRVPAQLHPVMIHRIITASSRACFIWSEISRRKLWPVLFITFPLTIVCACGAMSERVIIPCVLFHSTCSHMCEVNFSQVHWLDYFHSRTTQICRFQFTFKNEVAIMLVMFAHVRDEFLSTTWSCHFPIKIGQIGMFQFGFTNELANLCDMFVHDQSEFLSTTHTWTFS